MVAQRARDVEISGIRKMFEGAPANALNLGLGEPDFEPPTSIVEALCEAVQNGMNHYGPSAGISALRDKIAERYRDRDAETSRENVLITGGGSVSLMATAMALYDPGDEVLVPNPGFVLYTPHARLVGAIPVPYDLLERRRYLPDLDDLEARVTSRTRAIVVNSPSNPTGSVFPSNLVDRILDFAEAHDLYVISDEVYEEIDLQGPVHLVLGEGRPLGHRQFVLEDVRDDRMEARVRGRAPEPGRGDQQDELSHHRVPVDARPGRGPVRARERARIEPQDGPGVQGPPEAGGAGAEPDAGTEMRSPAGAFYAFPRFTWPGTSQEVAGDLLQRGLITTPGDAFGSLGANHLRLSFAASRTNLTKAMMILRRYANEVMRS